MTQAEEVTRTIVQTVAEYENVRPDDLPPLMDTIVAETVRRLTAMESQLTEPVTFEYLWYDVTVLPDGEVVVTP